MSPELRTYELASWSEIFGTVRDARAHLGGSTVWFRGHTDARFTLLPGLFRGGLSGTAANESERKAFEVFARLAPRFAIKEDKDWHTLVNMQHYGIPTRLLDWTSVLGLAVFFATSTYRPSRVDENDFSIYVLNPAKLNSNVGRGDLLI